MLPTELTSRRLLLRAPRPSDARQIFDSYTQAAEVSRFMIWRPHTELHETEAFIAQCIEAFDVGSKRPYVLALRNAPDAPIGMLEARPDGPRVEIGYVLAREFWGLGLMPEAIECLSNAILASPEFFRVQATCDVENPKSARALEKAGFTREGRLERYMVHPNVSDEPRASYLYAKWR